MSRTSLGLLGGVALVLLGMNLARPELPPPLVTAEAVVVPAPQPEAAAPGGDAPAPGNDAPPQGG